MCFNKCFNPTERSEGGTRSFREGGTRSFREGGTRSFREGLSKMELFLRLMKMLCQHDLNRLVFLNHQLHRFERLKLLFY